MNKTYLDKSKNFFESSHNDMVVNNHEIHNSDPNYWDYLLGAIKNSPENWSGKKALDFGCGCGRNIKNLLDLASWKQVDGCDISKKNADYSKNWVHSYYPDKKIKTWENSGENLHPCEENYYDFIMSHIVFQHIPSYSIRFSILEDMFRCLKKEGLVSLHYQDLGGSVPYHFNHTDSNEWFTHNTKNGLDEPINCRVEDKQYLIDDFKKIGFSDITCEVTIPFLTQPDWVGGSINYYIKAYKK